VGLKKRNVLRKARKLNRIRKVVKASERPRVSVFRSAKQIYAQLIDDSQNKTLASFSSLKFSGKADDKKEVAREVGKELGKLVKDLGVSKVAFDRGNYLYHGRVQSLAEGLRESGLEF